MATRPSPDQRFWAKVNKDGPIPIHRPDLGQCWVWTGESRHGYGFIRFAGLMDSLKEGNQ